MQSASSLEESFMSTHLGVKLAMSLEANFVFIIIEPMEIPRRFRRKMGVKRSRSSLDIRG